MLFTPEQSGGTITDPQYMTVKMVTADTAYYYMVVKEVTPVTPFNFLDVVMIRG